MTLSIEELYDRALALSSDVEDKFLELGRSLRQLLDRDPALFQQVVKKLSTKSVSRLPSNSAARHARRCIFPLDVFGIVFRLTSATAYARTSNSKEICSRILAATSSNSIFDG